MRSKFNRLIRSRKAQGMTEYIIIVALIAIASIAVVTIFGNSIRQMFGAAAQGLTGAQNVNIQQAQTAGSQTRNLQNWSNNMRP